MVVDISSKETPVMNICAQTSALVQVLSVDRIK